MSSPNTPGLRELQHGEHLKGILDECQKANRTCAKQNDAPEKPLLIKVAPDLSTTELESILDMAISCGIDGIIASAAGFQAAHNKPCIVTIGDLAAWHDLSSLMHLAAFRQPLLLIISNNGGGGIFSFLPISKESDAFESHFAVAHNMRFAELSKAM